jgi:hypothetical protein
MAGLPPIVHALAELSPVEDILLYVLRQGLPGVQVQSLIADDQGWPLVLVRRLASFGEWNGDERFIDQADVAVQCFAEDPDSDRDAALLAEAVRVVLRDAWVENAIVPGRGHITRITMTSAPRRAADFATATGPVQYADLPTGVTRYESQFRVSVRKAPTPHL